MVLTVQFKIKVDNVQTNIAGLKTEDKTPHQTPPVEVVEAKLPEADNVDMVLPGRIDAEKNRFPYSIVWTPIPLLT